MADDPELAKWRAQRMAQMQAGGASNPAQSQQAAQERQQKEAAMEEQRRLILKQILSDAASERLSNIRLVKPEKARQVEGMVISAAQGGRLSGKLSDDQLKDLLVKVSEQTQRQTKVTISRRRRAFDEDDEDDDEDF